MFLQPQTYPLVPQKVRDFLRQIQGVTVPKCIEGKEIEILADIQVAKVGDTVIPIYSSVEDAWVDVVYDSWIQMGKVESIEVEELATNWILSNSWWEV